MNDQKVHKEIIAVDIGDLLKRNPELHTFFEALKTHAKAYLALDQFIERTLKLSVEEGKPILMDTYIFLNHIRSKIDYAGYDKGYNEYLEILSSILKDIGISQIKTIGKAEETGKA